MSNLLQVLDAANPAGYIAGGKGMANEASLTDDQQKAYDTILNGIDGQGQSKERFAQLKSLYQQEEDLYKQGRALTTDRELRDQYRDAWKALNVDTTYTNPYMTGDWYGQQQAVSDMADRAANWQNEVSQYQTQPAQSRLAVAAAYRTPTGTQNIVSTALKGLTNGAGSTVTASPTRSTYQGDIA